MTLVGLPWLQFLVISTIISRAISFQVSDVDRPYSWQDSRYTRYDVEDVVRCLDSTEAGEERQTDHRHFALMGDSRIRHLFYSFTQMFPDYDYKWENTSLLEWAGHHDNQVGSWLLNLTISFKWRPYLEDGLTELIAWTFPFNEAPDWLIMGMASWHIHFNRDTRQESLEGFESSLTTLVPIFKKLTRRTNVLWINQLPVAENLAKAFCSKCYQNAIELFNAAARRILRGTGVVVWDSDGQLGMEYVRSCTVNSRYDMLYFWNCPDYIHTGFVALNRRINMLINFVCNRTPSKQ